MQGSWRTTAAGLVQLVIAVATALGAIVAGVEVSPEQAGAVEDAARTLGLSWSQQLILAMGSIGVVAANAWGLVAARDNKVTSEEAGAKR